MTIEKVCPRCEGIGYFGNMDNLLEDAATPCPKCGGTGGDSRQSELRFCEDHGDVKRVIDQAIAAERERCARIAEAHEDPAQRQYCCGPLIAKEILQSERR